MQKLTQLTVVAFIVAIAVVPGAGQADAALPRCTGPNIVQDAPYNCRRVRPIEDTTVKVRIHVPVTGPIKVVIELQQPRALPTDLRVRLFYGLASDGIVQLEQASTLPPGGTGAIYEFDPCPVNGQLQVNAVIVADGADQGRVAAPFVRRPSPAQGCGT
jgi:hypothetical protein